MDSIVYWSLGAWWLAATLFYVGTTFIAEPFLCAAGATLAGGLFWNHMFAAQTATAIFIFLAGWFALEALYLTWKGWSFSWQSPAAWIVRELLLPVLWLQACVTRSLIWRGSRMNFSGYGRSNSAAIDRT